MRLQYKKNAKISLQDIVYFIHEYTFEIMRNFLRRGEVIPKGKRHPPPPLLTAKTFYQMSFFFQV